jgi:hypothetical protein
MKEAHSHSDLCHADVWFAWTPSAGDVCELSPLRFDATVRPRDVRVSMSHLVVAYLRDQHAELLWPDRVNHVTTLGNVDQRDTYRIARFRFEATIVFWDAARQRPAAVSAGF